jgi:hypothetical protein
MKILRYIRENAPALVVVCTVGMASVLAAHVARSDAAFSHAYLDYAAVADDADTATYVPTATNNPLREEINAALVQVLGNTTSSGDRLKAAEHGLALLQDSEQEIDAISPKSDDVDSTISEMEKSLSPGDAAFQRGDPQKIIAFAKERQAAISDIRALSYRADFETGKIFQHVVDSKGVLTSGYVSELNNDIPAAEDEFNKRQNRYNDLADLLSSIQQSYDDFKSATADPANI